MYFSDLCTHYLVVSATALAAFGASNITEEELMHLRMDHCVSYAKMQVLSKSGAQGVNPQLKYTKHKRNVYMHANITRNQAPHQTATVRDMSFDLFDMSKITTIGGNRYCSVFIDNGRYATAIVHATKNEIPEVFDRASSETRLSQAHHRQVRQRARISHAAAASSAQKAQRGGTAALQQASAVPEWTR